MKLNVVVVVESEVHFTVSESGTYLCRIMYRDNIEYETTMNIEKNIQYFISHESIRNYGSSIIVGQEMAKIHTDPVVNIITRVSRTNLFENCRRSVREQCYKNINHILTYETEFIGDLIKSDYKTYYEFMFPSADENVVIDSRCNMTDLKNTPTN